MFFHSGIFCPDKQTVIDKLPQSLHECLPLNSAKFLKAPGPEPEDLCHRSWLLLCNPSSVTHHPGSYQKKSGIWRMFLSQPRFWCLSFIFVSGSKLLKQRGIFLLNSTSFELCFSFLRYVPFLFIFDVRLCRGTKINLLSVFTLYLYFIYSICCFY